MLWVRALRLDNNRRDTGAFGMDDGAVRQADVDVNRSNLPCLSEVENGSATLHVLLDCHSTAKTRDLCQCSTSTLPHRRSSIRIVRPNEKEISHDLR